MQKVTLEKVFVSDKNKEGKPYISQFNKKPQLRLGIQIHGDSVKDEKGQRWLSTFIDMESPASGWKQGDEVYIKDISENNGFWNFRIPTATDYVFIRLEALEKRVQALEARKEILQENIDESIEDLPF